MSIGNSNAILPEIPEHLVDIVDMDTHDFPPKILKIPAGRQFSVGIFHSARKKFARRQ
jgi:hypothetical protein